MEKINFYHYHRDYGKLWYYNPADQTTFFRGNFNFNICKKFILGFNVDINSRAIVYSISLVLFNINGSHYFRLPERKTNS